MEGDVEAHCFRDKPQSTGEAGPPCSMGWGAGPLRPLQVPADDEEPLPTVWLLPSRWSRAGLQTGGIQAIWSCARRRRRRRQQLELGSALPPNLLAYCTGGISAPQVPSSPGTDSKWGTQGGMLGTVSR